MSTIILFFKKLHDHFEYFKEFPNSFHSKMPFSMEIEKENSTFFMSKIFACNIFTPTLLMHTFFSGIKNKLENFLTSVYKFGMAYT